MLVFILLFKVLFILTAGVTIEEMENEAKMEEKGILEDEMIGVVFKDDFSYTLRFQMGRMVFPNEGFEHIGNKINETTGFDFALKTGFSWISVLLCHSEGMEAVCAKWPKKDMS